MSEEVVTEKTFSIKVDGQGYNIRVATPNEKQLHAMEQLVIEFQKSYNEQVLAAYLGFSSTEELKKPPFSNQQVRARIMQAILEISGQKQPEPEDPYSSKEALGRKQMKPENRKARLDEMMRTKMPQAERSTIEE